MLRLILFILLGAVLVGGSWFCLETYYRYDQFASKKAQTSLEVTEAQSAELLASRKKSDLYAFMLLGAAIAGSVGATCNRGGKGIPGGVKGLLLGLFLGAAAGALASEIGHFHDANVPFPTDPMVYWFLRWWFMLIPIGLAAGVSSAIAGSTRQILDCCVGSQIGVLVAVAGYCLMSGLVTSIELHTEIYPAFPANRGLIVGLAAALIGVLTLLRSKPVAVASQQETNSESTTNEA